MADDSGYEIGQTVPGKGVYFGRWQPRDWIGNSLGKTFNLFAAPYDLGFDERGRGQRLTFTYNEAVKRVGEIRGLLGHRGGRYADNAALGDALKSGRYKGEWFIPTRDILTGTIFREKNLVQADNLFAHRGRGALAGFADDGLYLTSSLPNTRSRTREGTAPLVYTARPSDGWGGWVGKDDGRHPVRLVRAELVASQPRALLR